MREIKFRAYVKEKSLLAKVDQIFFGSKYVAVWDIKEQHMLNLDFCKVDLMQYTGLKDKNGKEIYEGDIVRTVCYDNDDENSICEIKYENLSFYICEISDGYRWEPDTELEIIGKIYENPELLNEK